MKIKDIAEALHLSVSTVSKALNGAFDVSKETKEMVIKYAKLHGYKAKDERLATKKLRRLCVLYDNVDFTNQSNTSVLVGLAFSKYAYLHNFEVVHCQIDAMGKKYEKYMNENNFDGAFIVGLNYKSQLLLELKNTSIPTVLYDNFINSDKISTICCENINMMVKMVSILYDRGHRKIGFIHGDKNSYIANERYAGYITGLVMTGLEYNPKYVFFGEFSQKSGIDASKYFIDTDVTAIICASDIIAIGLINGLKAEGLCVPNDISVTGYDDLDIAKLMSPSLTTVNQDLERIGEKAFSLMSSILMNRSSQKIIIDGKIEIRDSIGLAKER